MKSTWIRLACGGVALVALSACIEDNGGAIDPGAQPTTSATTKPPKVLTYYVTMDGAAETPPGDPDGRGTATISIDANTSQVCVDLNAENLAEITNMHIHEGDATVPAGKVVVPLPTPTAPASNGCSPAGSDIVARIEADPSSFYLNVHTVEFPDGAIRGQLG